MIKAISIGVPEIILDVQFSDTGDWFALPARTCAVSLEFFRDGPTGSCLVEYSLNAEPLGFSNILTLSAGSVSRALPNKISGGFIRGHAVGSNPQRLTILCSVGIKD